MARDVIERHITPRDLEVTREAEASERDILEAFAIEAADQSPGLHHVYGSGALRFPSAEVVPATHSDHDVLLVRAHLAAGP